jgi:hypothetical protein
MLRCIWGVFISGIDVWLTISVGLHYTRRKDAPCCAVIYLHCCDCWYECNSLSPNFISSMKMGYTSIICMISEDVNKVMYVLLQSFVYVYASKTTPINEIKLLQNLHPPDNLKRIKWAMKHELNLWLEDLGWWKTNGSLITGRRALLTSHL